MKSVAFALFRSLLSLTLIVGLVSVTAAQETPTQAPPAKDPPAAPGAVAPAPLASSQEVITMRYRRFEETLLQLSEYLRKSDPQRAELLTRAIGKSQEGRVQDQLRILAEILRKDQLGDAIEREEEVIVHMQAVLQLLMSEDRRDEIEKERARIKDLIKDVNNLIAKQTDARVNTERGGDPNDLQRQQKQVADGTQKLVNKIDGQDAQKKTDKQKGDDKSKPGDKSTDKKPDPKDGDPKGGDPKDGDPKDGDPKDGDPKDGDPKDAKPGDSKDPSGKDGKKDKDADKPGNKDPKAGTPKDPKDPKAGEPKPGDPKPSDAKPGDPKDGDPKDGDPKPGDPKDAKPGDSKPGKPQSGKPKPGKPQPGQPQDQPPPDGQQPDDQKPDNQKPGGDDQKPDKTAGRDEIEKAKKEMDRAIEELKQKRNAKASDNQDQALADLLKAKEKLEEILRQLREEERAMVLAALEARFRDMLLRQEAVNNGTIGIHAVPLDKRSDRHRNRSVELARNEDEISLLAAKALTLLREEGSSVAFPEAVEQIRDDMLTVARRLERADVGEITQNIEQDIVESLREILEALQKELEKLKDKKDQPPQQQQQQQQQPPPLVNKLAELKMLRSLQYRVNRRTKQMGRLVDGEQALDVDVVSQLKQLSDRQAKVQRATHDLATGKNE